MVERVRGFECSMFNVQASKPLAPPSLSGQASKRSSLVQWMFNGLGLLQSLQALCNGCLRAWVWSLRSQFILLTFWPSLQASKPFLLCEIATVLVSQAAGLPGRILVRATYLILCPPLGGSRGAASALAPHCCESAHLPLRRVTTQGIPS